ncbi:SSU ribosomal protein S8P [Brevinema andersonii]|uniref:Small ribosomal subunit protein uS8 n=1 Tax=Brevinema andersonii TaxID=34097 RepID=A0A1I1D1H6_BREAD|nr:30S ribosomal protein S8 [Brevinema andersonii]SFB68212.1 SSU ribosomal protein S8P [Brevinema andersonii]
MDIIADSLTKIRNAAMRKLSKTTVKKTKLIEELLKIMKREGYIDSYKDSSDPYTLDVYLKYIDDKCVIDDLKRVSKLSRRVYVGKDSIPSVYNNYGIAILTTSKGVITDKEARSLGVGGEVLCYIW